MSYHANYYVCAIAQSRIPGLRILHQTKIGLLVKSEFKGQIVSKFDLGLLNHSLMHTNYRKVASINYRY